MFRRHFLPVVWAALVLSSALWLSAQTVPPASNDAVRVTVTMNADGTRTTYRYDNAKHEAVATTADADGKAKGKVVYRMDDAGRFSSGDVFGPDEKFLFRTVYKYDAAGRLEQETHVTKEDALINRIVYKYNAAGKQVGFSVFDASGTLISGAGRPNPSVPPKSHNIHGH